jgi:hypothetical protein
VRSFDQLVPTATFGFAISVLFDSFDAGRFLSTPMTLTVDADLHRTTLDSPPTIDSLPTHTDGPSAGARFIDTMRVLLGISRANSGPSIVAYYAARPIYIAQDNTLYYNADTDYSSQYAMHKVLVRWYTRTFDFVNPNILTKLMYTLTEYSVTPN